MLRTRNKIIASFLLECCLFWKLYLVFIQSFQSISFIGTCTAKISRVLPSLLSLKKFMTARWEESKRFYESEITFLIYRGERSLPILQSKRLNWSVEQWQTWQGVSLWRSNVAYAAFEKFIERSNRRRSFLPSRLAVITQMTNWLIDSSITLRTETRTESKYYTTANALLTSLSDFYDVLALLIHDIAR